MRLLLLHLLWTGWSDSPPEKISPSLHHRLLQWRDWSHSEERGEEKLSSSFCGTSSPDWSSDLDELSSLWSRLVFTDVNQDPPDFIHPPPRCLPLASGDHQGLCLSWEHKDKPREQFNGNSPPIKKFYGVFYLFLLITDCLCLSRSDPNNQWRSKRLFDS